MFYTPKLTMVSFTILLHHTSSRLTIKDGFSPLLQSSNARSLFPNSKSFPSQDSLLKMWLKGISAVLLIVALLHTTFAIPVHGTCFNDSYLLCVLMYKVVCCYNVLNFLGLVVVW